MEDELQLPQKFPNPLGHPQHLHCDRFKVDMTESGAMITFIKSDHYYTYSWLKGGQISKGKTVFTIKQIKTVQKFILTGIATDAIFGTTNALVNRQSITYYSKNGYIWQNGRDKKGGRIVEDGELIKMVVDTIQWSVVWYVDTEQLAKAIIPQMMRKKSLFLVIMMWSENDKVELLYV